MEGEGERRQEDKETPGEEDQRRKEGEGLQNVGDGITFLVFVY